MEHEMRKDIDKVKNFLKENSRKIEYIWCYAPFY